MAYQDIQIPDEALRTQFISYWQNQDYAEAFALLSNTQLTNKVNNAAMWNDITTTTVTVENLSDPTFKQNKIQVSSTPPTLSTGEIYFKLLT